MEPIRRPGLWIEKHITPCFRNLFQKMLCFAAQGQQTLSLEDIPVPDIKIGPRQGEKFTLPQTAGQSCVDERENAKLFRRIEIPLKLPQAQEGIVLYLFACGFWLSHAALCYRE